ncbi:MAG: DUF4097 family beta strand repeat-containing protein [Vicinamibacterales bacterium]
MFLTTAALIAALGATPAAAQGGPDARAPQTDQTVPVARGARLTVDNFAGDVVIRAWERDAIRVQARHASRTRVSVRTSPTGIGITASGLQGPASAVDYEINVPVWIPIKVDGTYAFISVEGTESEVGAETVRGDIRIKGGAGLVSGKSIEGKVVVSGAKGRVTVSSVNQGVTITGATGDIVAETTNGAIMLSGIESEHADVGSVNGSITYDGTPAPHGRYRFSTHNGNIIVALPENSSAAFSVRTYNGNMSTNLPLQGSGDARRGRRVTYTLGAGSAEFELESFGGTIRLNRTGTLPPSKSKTKSKDR